jgi:hypothetical protein
MHRPRSPLALLTAIFAGLVNRHQRGVIDYLLEENRILRAKLGKPRLQFTDAERRRLARKGGPLGRKILDGIASIVTPDTILACHHDVRRVDDPRMKPIDECRSWWIGEPQMRLESDPEDQAHRRRLTRPDLDWADHGNHVKAGNTQLISTGREAVGASGRIRAELQVLVAPAIDAAAEDPRRSERTVVLALEMNHERTRQTQTNLADVPGLVLPDVPRTCRQARVSREGSRSTCGSQEARGQV